MVSRLELYNGALQHLGPVRLASVTENRPDRRELDAVYQPTNDYMLERAIWRFALRVQQWTADADVEPLFGLTYAYSIPDDFAGHFGGIGVDERMNSEDINFQIANGYLYSDQPQLYVSYVSDGPAYGMDLGKWPQMFADAHAAEMAYRSGLPITKDGVTKANLNLTRLQLLDAAKRNHAVDERVKYKPTSSWVRSRFANGYRDQRRARI